MEIGFGLVITLIGMVVVFLTLTLLLVIVGLPKVFLRKEKPQVEPAIPEGIPPQHIAAIAGALAMLDGSYRIKIIEIIGNENWERSRYTDIATL
ncbi:MAG: hypothetical protein ACOX21_07045 [Bacillota bacterium]|jgi:Na+-transporting methylmalonyl-CoA/oxaloacetate decarboxylase gamma subunit|nr:hypothetical protein [Bacillota bacterium]HOC07217.1 hypothetical protein [Bacillota bacterium]HPZ22859.1 hypothetical protein [Bacillota bacterium]HQD20595.1 hypothetical protein [Bacillota bacterium]